MSTTEFWRPMETATRTGEWLIGLYDPKGTDPMVFAMQWTGMMWMRDTPSGPCGFNVSCKPTHWMPMPEAPRV